MSELNNHHFKTGQMATCIEAYMGPELGVVGETYKVISTMESEGGQQFIRLKGLDPLYMLSKRFKPAHTRCTTLTPRENKVNHIIKDLRRVAKISHSNWRDGEAALFASAADELEALLTERLSIRRVNEDWESARGL